MKGNQVFIKEKTSKDEWVKLRKTWSISLMAFPDLCQIKRCWILLGVSVNSNPFTSLVLLKGKGALDVQIQWRSDAHEITTSLSLIDNREEKRRKTATNIEIKLCLLSFPQALYVSFSCSASQFPRRTVLYPKCISIYLSPLRRVASQKENSPNWIL